MVMTMAINNKRLLCLECLRKHTHTHTHTHTHSHTHIDQTLKSLYVTSGITRWLTTALCWFVCMFDCLTKKKKKRNQRNSNMQIWCSKKHQIDVILITFTCIHLANAFINFEISCAA